MHGYKQEEVMRFLGLRSMNRISLWEKGIVMPSAGNLFKLSILYHALVDQLYYEHIKDMKRTMLEKTKLLEGLHRKKKL